MTFWGIFRQYFEQMFSVDFGYRSTGRADEAAQLKGTLHRNLMYLASVAAAATAGEDKIPSAANLVLNVNGRPEGEVDFDSLKSLADDGIDMSFLDSLKDKYNEVFMNS